MNYDIEIKPSVLKDLKKLPIQVMNRIIKKIQELKQTPKPNGCKKLKGHENIYRIRIGVYRVIYSINDGKLIVMILLVGHRKDVYESSNLS